MKRFIIFAMKKLKTISALSMLSAITLVACHPAISSFNSSSSDEPIVASSNITTSKVEDSSVNSSNKIASSTYSNSSQISPSSSAVSSNQVASSSYSSSSSSFTSSSSSVSSQSISAHSSSVSSSSSSASSSSVSSNSSSSSVPSSSPTSVSSSSNVPSSSISPSSSQAPSSTSAPSSSSNSSSNQSTSSSSSSSSSSSIPDPDNPLANYQVIGTFSKRMPGEFEPAQMIKMCYPINMPISVYKAISDSNKVLLLVNPDNANRSRITKARSELVNGGVNADNVTFIDMNIDDDYAYWVRDFSPFYVFRDKQLTITDFTYNRPQRTEQNAVPNKLATYFNIPYYEMSLTHTGGNLMQDGRGTAFSDDLVVKENNNNATRVRIRMKTYTGTSNYVITIDPQGDYIAHIDCWGKIVAPDKIIVAKLPQSNSRYKYYEQVANELANTKCAYGYNYRIYRVEEPGGNTVAPYTNSLIANGHVYVPLGSNSSYNEKALAVYREALPGYDVVGLKGFSSNDYYDRQFLNTDALHCRTHEVPDQNMVFIDSREVYYGEVPLKDNYVIKANVISYANEELDNVTIHYSINDSQFIEKPMNQYLDTTNYTFIFSGLEKGDEVKYYIDAKDTNNNYNIDPTCGQLDPHHFVII